MLQTDTLKADLKQAWKDARNSNAGEDTALDAFVNTLCDKLEVWVKTLHVVYLDGLTSSGGIVTGEINHTVE